MELTFNYFFMHIHAQASSTGGEAWLVNPRYPIFNQQEINSHKKKRRDSLTIDCDNPKLDVFNLLGDAPPRRRNNYCKICKLIQFYGKENPIMGWTSLNSCFYNFSHNDKITSNPNHPSEEKILIIMFCDKVYNKFPKKWACKNIESENSIFLWSSIMLPPF